MHCDRCNVDFPEGLRYCKWCGEDLTGVAPKSRDASVTIPCSSCGERLDTGSLYCKGCGSAVYTEQTPFGGSALLCGTCNSYSPVGSRACRVCGASLVQGARTIVDFPAAAPTVQQKAPTLPDLDEPVEHQAMTARADQEQKVESGANTLTFTKPEPQTGTSVPRGQAETNMLPGTAGSRSEQQAPTSIMHMGRITGPVEGADAGAPPNESGELTNSPAGGPSGAMDGESPELREQRIRASDPTIQMASVSQPPTAPRPTTLGLGSDSESEAAASGSENKTAVFVSSQQGVPPEPREQAARDDIGTRPITRAAPSESEPTREFQQPTRKVTADHVASTVQMASAPQWTEPEPVDFTATPALLQPNVQTAPPPKKRTGVVIATLVVALILIGGAVYVGWLLFGRGKPSPSVPVAVEPPPVAPVAPPEKPPTPVVPEGMLAVTAGTYAIGRDGADPLEQPEHRVALPAFFIDRAEVTNAAYKKFVDATGHKVPSNWGGPRFPEGHADFPVTGVTWQDASDYAAWAGKRLPTEVEWEAAARGADGRIYPWGNDWRSGVANIGLKPDKPTPDQYPPGIKEVGRYPQGASPVGAVDMIGNAWEWVADEINVYPGNTESKLDLESGVTYRVIRGGAYDGSKVNDATYRGYLDGSQPYPKVGFRCAKDAK